jgi:hypothetical protein
VSSSARRTGAIGVGAFGVLVVVELAFAGCDARRPAPPEQKQRQPPSTPAASPAPFELASIPAARLVKVSEDVRSIPFPNSPPAPPTRVPSPRGDRVAEVVRVGTGVESSTHRIIVSSPDRRQGVAVADVTNLSGLIWSPDGSKIAFCEGAILHVADADGRTQRALHVGPGGPYPGACFDIAWTGRGDEIAFVEVQNASDPELGNPVRVTVKLAGPR